MPIQPLAKPNPDALNDLDLKFLTAEQARCIDELLAGVGEYGEIHLIVQRGELRFINQVVSYKAPADHEK